VTTATRPDRTLAPVNCLHCGEEFTLSSTSNRICSSTCAHARQRRQIDARHANARVRQSKAFGNLGIHAESDTGPYVVVYEIESPYSGTLPIVHSQHNTEQDAMTAAQRAVRGGQRQIRVEHWTTAPCKTGGGGGRDGERIIAVIEPPQPLASGGGEIAPAVGRDGDSPAPLAPERGLPLKYREL
jgi:hypothetical protein